MATTLGFYGAARQVTGSKHLLTVGPRRVLLECGMVQGPRKIANRANAELPFEASSIDAVVLSHAHIDHCGSLPLLVKRGYRGPIHCTAATADLTALLLRDSAQIQVQDAAYLRKQGIEVAPPYDQDDVDRTVRQLQPQDYREAFEVDDGVRAQFLDAGHILGSAMVVLDADDNGRSLRLGFTGDHGRQGTPILRDPARMPDVDYLITESTYGDRLHADRRATLDEIAALVEAEQRDGGRILIPAFAVGRTQEVLYWLARLLHEGRIPPTRVWVDSPLSKEATKIVARHVELYDKEARALVEQGQSPFFFDEVRYVADVEESKTLNGVREGVIVASSGMCEGGRIVHHLKQSIGRSEDCVATVGFMAQGTLGRKLVDGYEHVRLLGERHRVRCKVRSIPGLSAHADWKELCDNLAHLAPSVRKAFVVHGEEDAATRFADRLLDAGFRDAEAPVFGEVYEL